MKIANKYMDENPWTQIMQYEKNKFKMTTKIKKQLVNLKP